MFTVTEEDGARRIRRDSNEKRSDAALTLPNCVYFEVHIDSLQPGAMFSVGFGRAGFPVERYQPGWKASSYAYHSDDGCKYTGSAVFSSVLGPAFGVRDVVGCGKRASEIYWTLNGVEIGSHRPPVGKKKLIPLVPCIGSDGGISLFVTLEHESPKLVQGSDLRQSALMSLSNNTPLPHLVSVGILYLLIDSPKDYAHYSLVCKTFQKAAQNNVIWLPLVSERWPALPPIQMKSWFRFYRNRARAEIEQRIRADTAAILACDWELECPLLYENLSRIDDQKSHCETCKETVWLVRTKGELHSRVFEGKCVAYDARQLASTSFTNLSAHVINIGVFGGPGSGKTSFITPYILGRRPTDTELLHWSEICDPIESYRKVLTEGDETRTLDILDVGIDAEELLGDWNLLAGMVLRQLDVFVLCFDMSSRKSFQEVHELSESISRMKDVELRELCWVLIGTHYDEMVEVSTIEAEDWGRENLDAQFFPVCSTDDFTVGVWDSIITIYDKWQAASALHHRVMGKRSLTCDIF